jgi:hypothetical protein
MPCGSGFVWFSNADEHVYDVAALGWKFVPVGKKLGGLMSYGQA